MNNVSKRGTSRARPANRDDRRTRRAPDNRSWWAGYVAGRGDEQQDPTDDMPAVAELVGLVGDALADGDLHRVHGLVAALAVLSGGRIVPAAKPPEQPRCCRTSGRRWAA